MVETIIICSTCKGEGIIHCQELIDYHNNDYKYWKEKCSECKGSGRLIQSVTISTKAYIPIDIAAKTEK
jgi:DnaJ-class molecular chaperone